MCIYIWICRNMHVCRFVFITLKLHNPVKHRWIFRSAWYFIEVKKNLVMSHGFKRKKNLGNSHINTWCCIFSVRASQRKYTNYVSTPPVFQRSLASTLLIKRLDAKNTSSEWFSAKMGWVSWVPLFSHQLFHELALSAITFREQKAEGKHKKQLQHTPVTSGRSKLVGGFNSIEKYAGQNGNLP